VRQVFQYAGFARENRRRDDGDRGVLRAADGNGSFEPPSAFDLITFLQDTIDSLSESI
jgi:hypothetical protein